MKKFYFQQLHFAHLHFTRFIKYGFNTTIEVNLIYKLPNLPVTYQNISFKEIKNKSIGQEPSLFLSNTPSIVAHTDGVILKVIHTLD